MLQPFAYSSGPHVRRHAPSGYSDYREYKDWLRDEFAFRCAYCLQRERWSREGAAVFGVDHVIPQSAPTGSALACEYANLLYACNRCNSLRQDYPLPVDPARAALSVHVAVAGDGSISSDTLEGQELIELLHLNAKPAVLERRRILNILADFAVDPNDAIHRENYHRTFGYPDDLPDLASKRPPSGNELRDNALTCHHARRASGDLPDVY